MQNISRAYKIWYIVIDYFPTVYGIRAEMIILLIQSIQIENYFNNWFIVDKNVKHFMVAASEKNEHLFASPCLMLQ